MLQNPDITFSTSFQYAAQTFCEELQVQRLGDHQTKISNINDNTSKPIELITSIRSHYSRVKIHKIDSKYSTFIPALEGHIPANKNLSNIETILNDEMFYVQNLYLPKSYTYIIIHYI